MIWEIAGSSTQSGQFVPRDFTTGEIGTAGTAGGNLECP